MVKKLLKVIVIVLAVLALVLAGLLWYGSRRQMVPENYENTASTGRSIEARYMRKGDEEVLYKEYPMMQSLKNSRSIIRSL